MKHNFEEHKQNRIDNANRQAEKNGKLSENLYRESKKMQSCIPMGQPILVGHHSEKRDRRFRAQIHNKLGKAFQAMDKADYYRRKAQNIQHNYAIYSDDPTALEQRQKKLAELEVWQQFMKDANRCIRKKDQSSFMKLTFATEQLWKELNTPDRAHGLGFPHYKLQNNNAEIKRQKGQIALLEAQLTMLVIDLTFNGVRLFTNKEANRVQLIFTGKPSEEIRKSLKQHGFKWSPTEGAWQRHLTPEAVRIASHLLNTF